MQKKKQHKCVKQVSDGALTRRDGLVSPRRCIIYTVTQGKPSYLGHT